MQHAPPKNQNGTIDVDIRAYLRMVATLFLLLKILSAQSLTAFGAEISKLGDASECIADIHLNAINRITLQEHELQDVTCIMLTGSIALGDARILTDALGQVRKSVVVLDLSSSGGLFFESLDMTRALTRHGNVITLVRDGKIGRAHV